MREGQEAESSAQRETGWGQHSCGGCIAADKRGTTEKAIPAFAGVEAGMEAAVTLAAAWEREVTPEEERV